MTASSAPGKIILFGEHAVVYGRPALAVPVTQVHADVEIGDSDRAGIWINAPAVDLHAELNSLPSSHPVASVVRNFFSSSGISALPPLDINISSTIPVASGLGSGAAVSVALVRALSSFFFHPLSDEQVNACAYEIEKLHHGMPSGIDNTVIAYARPVYFTKGQPIETFTVGNPFTIVIADTGQPAPTKESVGAVRRLWMNDRPRWETVFDKIGEISFTARRAIEFCKQTLSEIKGQVLLGELMNENHGLLQELTVSSPGLDALVESARKVGALGAKLSGGGRGGNMIALVEKDSAQKVAQALMNAGAKNTIITQIT